MESSSSSSSPFQAPKEPTLQRSKIIWRTLLISNLALGAYIFAKAGKKDSATTHVSKKAKELSPPPIEDTTPIPEELFLPPPTVKPVTIPEPISIDQQRELFKWMLEEKRKLKPKDSKEKKQIDEDKAILKKYIRAESIPEF